MRRSAIPLVLLAALTFFAGLGHGAIADADEAFYAESAREMIASGDWLTPHYNYEPRFQKPPLYYWLTAAAYLVTGSTELAARFWSAFSGLGLVLLTAACGRRWFDADTGMLAGAIVATNFGYFAMGRMALPDLPLAFGISLAIYAAFVATLERERRPRRWLLCATVAAALGVLTKGPVALLIPALVVVPVLLIERRSLNLRASDVALALVALLGIAAPWYLAMWNEHGTAYLEGFFVGDNYERFATARFNDPRPWWFYLPILLGGLLPWTPLMLVWLGPLWQFVTRRRDVGTLELRLLLWALLPLLFYTVSVGKQPRYILPVLPPVALLLASSIIERTREWRSLDGARVSPRPSRAIVVGSVISGLFLVTLAALLYRARPLLIDASSQWTLGAVVAIGIVGVMVVGVSLTRGWRAASAVLALAAAVTFCALPLGALARAHDAPVQQMARAIQQTRTQSEPVATYKVFVRNLVYYTSAKQTDLINDDQLVAFLQRPERVLVVLPAEAASRVEREHGLALQRLALLPYFNDGNIKVRTLIWPDPNQDLERVLLVSNRQASGQYSSHQ